MPNLPLLRSLFQSRTDVFATRWEKGNQSGYMPAYQYDPYLYRQHKMKGGSFKDYNEKTYLPLSDAQIEKHLRGEQFIGIYPLLKDSTSWFLAADFDDQGWSGACRQFIQVCSEYHIPAYLERSRSGNGGHVWIFFEQNYPAAKSRKVCIHLLELAKVFSAFDKNASFDRLFPNQDSLSGKGLGNLIALPFHKDALAKGNSCFIDPDTLIPYLDQWQFLAQVKRTPTATLDEMYSRISENPASQVAAIASTNPGKLTISLDSQVHIAKMNLDHRLSQFIKDEFNFPNSEFYVKSKSGKGTWGIERYFNLIDESDQKITLPRGGIGKIIRFCRDNNIEYTFQDLRHTHKPIVYHSEIQLRSDQHLALEATHKKDFGVIVTPPGAGKTVIGLQIIAEKKQPALVLVHRKQLLEQWKERISAFLGIPRAEIGTIGQGKFKVKAQITIATIQSLSKALDKNELKTSFGTILIDECHHVPANTYRAILAQLQSYYMYGLTATPFRKFSDGKLIFLFLGEIIAELSALENGAGKPVQIYTQETSFEVPFNPKTDKFETLSKILVHDSQRNGLILKDVKGELQKGQKVILLTERKEHIESLHQYLKSSYEVLTLSGDDTEIARKNKWVQLNQGQFQVLITTGQMFGEGTDLPNLHCLFLCYPFSFEGKLIQYIGRVQRGETPAKIYDYHDAKIPYLHRMFLKRNAYYRKIQKYRSLFDDPDESVPETENTPLIEVNTTLKLPFDAFDFQYGSVTFAHFIPELNQNLQFEIENFHIRPELEVLKPYFAKTLGTKTIEINISATIENGKVIAQLATAPKLDLINREIIDSVKFRFVEEKLRSPVDTADKVLLDIDQVQKKVAGTTDLYNSGEELLIDFLKDTHHKHFAQLRYLADRHERQVLKLRFVLSPFSFVFLLAGEEQYHLILETLDTEEATYIWHLPKDKSQLRAALQEIDQALSVIQKLGRKHFLSTDPINFSRVLHDYSPDRKGFMIWKDNLEALIR